MEASRSTVCTEPSEANMGLQQSEIIKPSSYLPRINSFQYKIPSFRLPGHGFSAKLWKWRDNNEGNNVTFKDINLICQVQMAEDSYYLQRNFEM